MGRGREGEGGREGGRKGGREGGRGRGRERRKGRREEMRIRGREEGKEGGGGREGGRDVHMHMHGVDMHRQWNVSQTIRNPSLFWHHKPEYSLSLTQIFCIINSPL